MEIEKLLFQYSEKYLGSGNPNSEIYFICKEEGGKYDEKELAQVLTSWNKHGCKQTCDIKEGIDIQTYEEFYGIHAKFQPTWRKLIRFLCVYEAGVRPDNETLRSFQRNRFGCKDANHILLELLPLPNPSTKTWSYEYLNIPVFSDRAIFVQTFAKLRGNAIKELIESNKPKIVIFCSTDSYYMNYWAQIAGTTIPQNDGYYYTKKDSIIYIITPHPTRRGITNKYFENIALKAREMVSCI